MGYFTQDHSPLMVLDLLLLGFAVPYPIYSLAVVWLLLMLGFAALYPTYFYRYMVVLGGAVLFPSCIGCIYPYILHIQ